MQQRRRRHRERRKVMILIEETLALHVRYTAWGDISLSSSAKQRREMTTCKVLWKTDVNP